MQTPNSPEFEIARQSLLLLTEQHVQSTYDAQQVARALIVPTLCVVMQPSTLRVRL